MAQAAAAKVSEGRSKYQALTNLSVPQRSPETGLLTGQNDLVVKGEPVELTEREAANLMAVGPRAGRQTPAIRPLKDAKDPLPQLHPRALSGLLRQPVMPGPMDEGPRPDPPGSSKVVHQGPPEASPPQPGDESVPAITGALDLPPRASRTAT